MSVGGFYTFKCWSAASSIADCTSDQILPMLGTCMLKMHFRSKGAAAVDPVKKLLGRIASAFGSPSTDKMLMAFVAAGLA